MPLQSRQNSFLSRLQNLDTFRQIPIDLTSATTHGAYLTILAYTVCGLLFVAELYAYLAVTVNKTTEVDDAHGEHIWIDFDIQLYELPCKYTKVKVRDVIGDQELPILEQKITKENLNSNMAPVSEHSDVKHHLIHYDDAKYGHLDDDELAEEHPEYDADWDSSSDIFKHDDFNAVIKHHDFTFVNFGAEWCIHCRDMSPAWNKAEKKADSMEFKDKLGYPISFKMLRFNCGRKDGFFQKCRELGLRGYPTMLMYKKDGTFSEYRGPRTVDSLINSVTDFIHDRDVEHHSKRVHSSNELERGCRVHGQLKVRRVPGYFLLEADSSVDNLDAAMTNVSHEVNHLVFTHDAFESAKNYYASISRQVTVAMTKNLKYFNGMSYVSMAKHTNLNHYLTVIPTILDDNAVIYQSVHQSHVIEVDPGVIPEARFSYEFSPIAIKVSSTGRTFYDFLTSVFAIVGGTFTFISLLHRFVDTVDKRFKKNINKLG